MTTTVYSGSVLVGTQRDRVAHGLHDVATTLNTSFLLQLPAIAINDYLKHGLMAISILISPLAITVDVSSELESISYPDGAYTASSESFSLDSPPYETDQETGIITYVNDTIRARVVDTNESIIILAQLLKRVAGDNYASVYNADRATALLILPNENEMVINSVHHYSNISGRIKVKNNDTKMFFMPKNENKNTISEYIKDRFYFLARLA